MLRLNYLTAFLALSLNACAGLPTFPTRAVWEVDFKNKVCGLYSIDDPERFVLTYIRDVDFAECPPLLGAGQAVFGFTSDDTGKVLTWMRGAVEYAKARCQ